MQRIKHMKTISMAVIAALLFSNMGTAVAAEPQEFSTDSQPGIEEEGRETGLDVIISDSDSLSGLPEADDEQATDFDNQEEENEKTEDTKEEEDGEPEEEETKPEDEAGETEEEENGTEDESGEEEEGTGTEDEDGGIEEEETEAEDESGEDEEETETEDDNGKIKEEESETEEKTEEEKLEDEEEELTVPAGVWSDKEPFFTDDVPAESSAQLFRMARAAGTCPTYQEAYNAMTSLKGKYPEGMTWTNFEPYGSKGDLGESYRFQGGAIKGASLGVGCAAFAFILSDEAFGSLPSRTIDRGGFKFEDIKVGDILRVDFGRHFVIVLQVSAGGVIVAEGNYNKSVHWGRAISAEDIIKETSFLVTRYPEGYTEEDNADETAQNGFEGSLSWTLTNAGVLTISGTGNMQNYTANERPSWENVGDINTIIIENGVTSIGNYAFYQSNALTVYIPEGITSIGVSAFQGSSLTAVTIPDTTSNVGDNAFRDCKNLTSVTISEGVKKIGDNAFRGCTSLNNLDFPASITSVGSGAFMSCEKVVQIRFAPGTEDVEIGGGAFAQCWNLANVTLPKRLTKISDNMFQSCTALEKIYIPASVIDIGENPFTSTRIQNGGTISFGGSETTWKKIGGQFILNAMPYAKIEYNVSFDDPFAVDPNDPGDLISGSTPSPEPSSTPSSTPSPEPGSTPSSTPGSTPSAEPSSTPGSTPSAEPDSTPGSTPSAEPSNAPGIEPSSTPSSAPSADPGSTPGSTPSAEPGNTPGGEPEGNEPGDNLGNVPSENNPDSSSGENADDNAESESNRIGSGNSIASSIVNSGIEAAVEIWRPVTYDEVKRYDCVGKETVQYSLSKGNDYQVEIKNAIQGPLCFKSFEAVLEDYTIGRTFDIHAPSGAIYSMDKEIEITIEIPSAIYKGDREYKMICVSKGGQPFVYNDLDDDPRTITIKTDKFYAYALIYKQK